MYQNADHWVEIIELDSIWCKIYQMENMKSEKLPKQICSMGKFPVQAKQQKTTKIGSRHSTSIRPTKVDYEFILTHPHHFFFSTRIKILQMPQYFIIFKISLF